MYKITFKFKDRWSHGKWYHHTALYRSVQDCIEKNGLGVQFEYKIIDVVDLSRKEVREDARN